MYNYFIQTNTKPHWMVIKYLPVLPPNLRPIVKLKNETIITTEINFLYSNIINSNNKILKLKKMAVPDAFLNNEKYFLQTKIDNLINSNQQKPFKNKEKNLRFT